MRQMSDASHNEPQFEGRETEQYLDDLWDLQLRGKVAEAAQRRAGNRPIRKADLEAVLEQLLDGWADPLPDDDV